VVAVEDVVVGAVVGAVFGAVVPGTVVAAVDGDPVDGLGLASRAAPEEDGVGVSVADEDGVGVPVGVGVVVFDDEPPRLLNVVPDPLVFAIGCPSTSSLTEMTAMAATKSPAATSRTGFQLIRCHTESRRGCASGRGSPGGSATSGCGRGTAGASVCRMTRVRLTRAARLREFE
jgi:hypothetical protein